MRLLVLSSQAVNTGSTMRAEYVYKYLKKNGVRADFIRPPFKSLPFMLDFILTLPYYFFRLMNKNYDAVFIVKPYPNTVLPAVLLSRGRPRIIIDIDDLDYGYRGGLFSFVIKFIQERLIPAADFITSHNDELIKLIKKKFPKFKNRVYKLNQCVDTVVFSPAKAKKSAVRRIRKRYSGGPVLFYMANLNVASYLGDIIEAVSKIKTEGIKLLVAGGGPLYGKYKKMAERKGAGEKAVFLGPLKKSEVVNYIAASDICLVYYKNVPVNKYRASMKLREYLAMKKPVVATPVGEIKKFREAVYFGGYSQVSFAKAIKNCVKSLDNRGKKGYKLVKREYVWGKEIKKFYKFISKREKYG